MVDAAEQHIRWMCLREMSDGKVLDLIERLDRSDTHTSSEELTELFDADSNGRQPQTPLTDAQSDHFVSTVS